MKKTCSSLEFKALMATQFLGALNDNLFKTIVSLLVLTHFVSQEQGVLFLSLTTALFALPYVLFSALAGYLADRFSKTKIIRVLKLFEAAIMLLALVAFYINNTTLILTAVFLMGLQSALYSPAKYGVLPELLPEEELSRGNGFNEFYTFLAIITGTALAGLVLKLGLGNPAIISLLIAITGIATSMFVGHQPSANASRHFKLDPVGPNIKRLLEIKSDRGLYLCVLGIAYFFFIGSTFQLNILVFGKEELRVDELFTSLLLAGLAIGIGLGSMLAGKTSQGKVELGLVPLGGLGLCLLSLLLSLTSTNYYLAFIITLFLGFSGGMFIVPINAYIQANSPPEKLGGYLAASNFLTFSGMIVASILYWLLKEFAAFSASAIFTFMGLISLLASVYLIRLLPEMMVRCLNWILIHLVYRIKTVGLENIPKTGGALLVSNHVSFIDAQLILASIDRPVRFIMFRPIYEHWLVKPVAKLNKAIPVAPQDGKENIEKTLSYAAELIRSGELVGIFAEGKITRDGQLAEFRTGLETIMRQVNAPIIPIYLAGLWGSIFSYRDGNPLKKLPKKIPYPMQIQFGSPLAGTTSAMELREKIGQMELESTALS